MGLNDSPVKMPELNLMPETERGIELDKGMKQVMSLLTAYWQEQRVTLKCSPSGVLFVTSPQIKDIFHVTGVGANYAYQGSDVQCSEVLIMGHPLNTGNIWVKPNIVATVDNAWPLAKTDVICLSLINLNMLNILIVVDGEKAIVAYTI